MLRRGQGAHMIRIFVWFPWTAAYDGISRQSILQELRSLPAAAALLPFARLRPVPCGIKAPPLDICAKPKAWNQGILYAQLCSVWVCSLPSLTFSVSSARIWANAF